MNAQGFMPTHFTSPASDASCQTIHSAARILVVDDEPGNCLLLRAILEEAGYDQIHTISDSRQTEEQCRNWKPDLILLDLMMPHLDGFQVMECLTALPDSGPFLPVLVLTADVSPQTRQRALSQGAHDFLTKPFDHTEVLLRIGNLLSLHFLHYQLHDQNNHLEERVLQRTREVEESQLEVLERLAHAAEFRDDDTGRHTQRVGKICELMARQLGFSKLRSDLIRHAAPLHDVGKIGIPDEILLKPGKLTPEEFAVMKGHAEIGANLLSGGRSELVQMAEIIARSHHERWDGTGYPNGLKESDIPLEGRVTAVVDVFDALTHERPYKRAWPVDEAIAEVVSQKGRQFDPDVVEAFLLVLDASVVDLQA